jgi:hypothetical protein
MKHYKLVTYVLFISLIWISCEKDNISPSIDLVSPLDNTSYDVGDILTVEFTISDNEELDYLEISFSGLDVELNPTKINLIGMSQNIKQEFILDQSSSGTLKLRIEGFDKAGNTAIIEKDLDYTYFTTGTLDFNIKLEYNGQPLVIFEDYNYPDGKKIDFTRVSFYTSEMSLDETPINEVEFHNLTNSHSSPALANEGYFWTLENVRTGSYNNLSFNIGVPAEFNNRDPGEFPSGHPLAKPSENWFSWMSYIFLKIEGNVDLDSDGEAETGVAIHTGSNEALRRLILDYPIQINENENTNVNLVFDIYQLFDGPSRIFPIEEFPQIHSLTQIDGVLEVSDNLFNSIH